MERHRGSNSERDEKAGLFFHADRGVSRLFCFYRAEAFEEIVVCSPRVCSRGRDDLRRTGNQSG